MYNRSELSKALKEAKAAKSQKKTADINVDIKGNGYKNPKNSNKPALKLYTDSIYNPTDKDLMLYPDNGMAPVFKPAWDTTTTYFPGANSIVEKQMARDGGRFVDKNDPGNNALELHMFYDKDIYQDGGEYLDLTDEEIEQYRKGGYVVEELPRAQTAGTTETPPNPMTYFDTQKPYTDRSGESLRLEKLKQQEDAVIPYYNERTGDFTTQEGTYKPDQYQKVEVSPGVFVARFKSSYGDDVYKDFSMDNKFNKDNYKHYTRGKEYWPIYSTVPYNETLQQWRAEDATETVEQPVVIERNGGYVNNQITHFQDGGLAKAQNGIQSQASNAPTDSVLTYAEYYAQTADAAKKAYDDYIIALEKEKQRVANVRKNIIPTAKTLDSADNYMLTDDWFNSPEGQAYSNYISAENPKQLEAARQTLTPTVKALLPNQGKYNVARWDANENQWNPRATPSRELYCTPYGCFTYQKAGANDVPIIGGNLDFVQKVNSGSLPFEKIPANQRQPGDMALWVENSPADYTDASKGYIRRPHHTTIYASPDADEPNNPEAGNYYNADNGVRLAYGLTNYETNIEPLDRMDYYRYIGQTKKMQDELIKKQAAWKAAENKADRGPRPTLATVALDRSYFNTERPQEDIIQVDYNQQMIDRINNMDISNKKKRKLLKNAEDVIAFNKTFQQPKSPILETSNVPTVNTQNSQIETFKKGGNMDPCNNALELHMFYDKNNFATGGTVEYLTQDEINQLRAGGITVIEE